MYWSSATQTCNSICLSIDYTRTLCIAQIKIYCEKKWWNQNHGPKLKDLNFSWNSFAERLQPHIGSKIDIRIRIELYRGMSEQQTYEFVHKTSHLLPVHPGHHIVFLWIFNVVLYCMCIPSTHTHTQRTRTHTVLAKVIFHFQTCHSSTSGKRNICYQVEKGKWTAIRTVFRPTLQKLVSIHLLLHNGSR